MKLNNRLAKKAKVSKKYKLSCTPSLRIKKYQNRELFTKINTEELLNGKANT